MREQELQSKLNDLNHEIDKAAGDLITQAEQTKTAMRELAYHRLGFFMNFMKRKYGEIGILGDDNYCKIIRHSDESQVGSYFLGPVDDLFFSFKGWDQDQLWQG